MRRYALLLLVALIATSAFAESKEIYWSVRGNRATRITVRGRVVSKVETVPLSEFETYLSRRLKDPVISGVVQRAEQRAASEASGQAGSGSGDGFRNTSWGMSPEQVSALFPGLLFREGTVPLVGRVQDSVAGRPGRLEFVFVDRKLVEVAVEVQGGSAGQDARIKAYDELQQLLTRKYGVPANQDVIWHKDIYQDQPDSWGFALSRGDFERFSIWRQEGTEIRLRLSGGNFQAELMLTYESLAHRKTRATSTLATKLGEI